MLYTYLGQKDIIMYDIAGGKKTIKYGDDINSDRFPDALLINDFVVCGAKKEQKEIITYEEKDEFKQQVNFQKQEINSLKATVSQLSQDIMELKADIFKLKSGTIVPEDRTQELTTKREPKKNKRGEDVT